MNIYKALKSPDNEFHNNLSIFTAKKFCKWTTGIQLATVQHNANMLLLINQP